LIDHAARKRNCQPSLRRDRLGIEREGVFEQANPFGMPPDEGTVSV
jgi:hypothetical protein